MSNHDQLTVRDIRGPYMQLLTNLQGENGREWLDALKVFNSRKNPWTESTSSEDDCWHKINTLVTIMKEGNQLHQALRSLAGVLQHWFSIASSTDGIENSASLDYIMRAVEVAIEDLGVYESRKGYIIGNLQQGLDGLEKNLKGT